MGSLFDRSASKKATNVSINRDLLRQARELEINLSQALEERLAEIVSERRRQQWLAENQEAIEAYNRRIADKGPFSDRLRRF
jgi:antitoxin CcdA